MPTKKKRAYVPKTKGCYECSQRRIHCDRGTPACQKCLDRDLNCSGLGIRHRFNYGVASRGNWTGKTMKTVYERSQPVVPSAHARNKGTGTKQLEPHSSSTTETISSPPQGTAPPAEPIPPALSTEKPVEPWTTTDMPSLDLQLLSTDQTGLSLPFWQNLLCCNLHFPSEDDYNHQSQPLSLLHQNDLEQDQQSDDAAPAVLQILLSSPSPGNLPLWERQLLVHYSDNIATEMVAIDGPHNGFRHLVLPMVHVDEMVLHAVLAISAYHMSTSSAMHHGRSALHHETHSVSLAQHNKFYERAIEGLRRRSQLPGCSRESQQSVIMTIILLLTATMVSGNTDFPLLFGLLQSALDAIGGDTELGTDEISQFIIRQVHKWRVYAAPLLSEKDGIAMISSKVKTEQMFDCLKYCREHEPRHSEMLDMIPDMVQQACEIYLGNVESSFSTNTGNANSNNVNPPSPEVVEMRVTNSINRVQRFKTTLEEYYSHGAPGEQVLIWAAFVAAFDCRLEDHKAFFEQFFTRHYARSRFRNLEMGLGALRSVWSRPPGKRWTSLLPQIRLFLM